MPRRPDQDPATIHKPNFFPRDVVGKHLPARARDFAIVIDRDEDGRPWAHYRPFPKEPNIKFKVPPGVAFHWEGTDESGRSRVDSCYIDDYGRVRGYNPAGPLPPEVERRIRDRDRAMHEGVASRFDVIIDGRHLPSPDSGTPYTPDDLAAVRARLGREDAARAHVAGTAALSAVTQRLGHL